MELKSLSQEFWTFIPLLLLSLQLSLKPLSVTTTKSQDYKRQNFETGLQILKLKPVHIYTMSVCEMC